MLLAPSFHDTDAWRKWSRHLESARKDAAWIVAGCSLTEVSLKSTPGRKVSIPGRKGRAAPVSDQSALASVCQAVTPAAAACRSVSGSLWVNGVVREPAEGISLREVQDWRGEKSSSSSDSTKNLMNDKHGEEEEGGQIVL